MSMMHSSTAGLGPLIGSTDWNAQHVTTASPGSIFFAGATLASTIQSISSDIGFQFSRGFFNVSGSQVLVGNLSTGTLSVGSTAGGTGIVTKLSAGGTAFYGNVNLSAGANIYYSADPSTNTITVNTSTPASIVGSNVSFGTVIQGSTQISYLTNLSGVIVGFNLSTAGSVTTQSRTTTNDAVVTGNISAGWLSVGSTGGGTGIVTKLSAGSVAFYGNVNYSAGPNFYFSSDASTNTLTFNVSGTPAGVTAGSNISWGTVTQGSTLVGNSFQVSGGSLLNSLSAQLIYGTYYEIGRITLTNASNSLIVSNLSAFPYLHIVVSCPGLSASDKPIIQFNNDSNANYAQNWIAGTGGNASAGNLNALFLDFGTAVTTPIVVKADVFNRSDMEKFTSINEAGVSVGAANAPNFRISEGKWANASGQITSVTFTTQSRAGLFANTTMIVYGAI